jgi:quercetin dioxygenase-like cupin family protein
MTRMCLVITLSLAIFSLPLAHAHAHEAGQPTAAPPTGPESARDLAQTNPESTGLLLLAEEGERMVRRWGLPMTIKVDPVNGGSQHLVVGTEDLPPGQAIPVHKHAHCDEVVVILQGTGTATLGERRRVVTPGAMLFIPQDEWVGLKNTGQETMRVVFIFSALGYDQYLRATSVPEGQAGVPFSPPELAEVRQKYRSYITFKEE